MLYACNSSSLQIPEGLSVPWGDTLCKRALEEERTYVEDVAVRLAGITGACPPAVPGAPAVLVFAADHGVVADGGRGRAADR